MARRARLSPQIAMSAVLALGMSVALLLPASGSTSVRPAHSDAPTQSDSEACEQHGRAVSADSWFCDGETLWGEHGSGDQSRKTESRVGDPGSQRDVQEWGSAEPGSRSDGDDRGSKPSLDGQTVTLSGYDTYCTDGHCEYPDPPYRYRLLDRVYYGTSTTGTIGRIERQLRLNMNGRQPQYYLTFARLSGPYVYGEKWVECIDTNGAWPDTRCGFSERNTGTYISSWSSGWIYGNKLTDNGDYFARYGGRFLAQNAPNPSASGGWWYPPVLTSHYWTCSGSYCKFH